MSILMETFHNQIINKLRQSLQIKNNMAVPKLEKIVLNMGVKDALSDKKNIQQATLVMAQIAGQKPKITKAKKSIASFKLREGDPIGLMVTLRGKRMYSFFEKLVNVVLPRLRDFHGMRRGSFDRKGNYTLGFTEFTVFPEIDPGKGDRVQGFEVVIVTTAKDATQGLALLEGLGMPFMKM